MSCVRRLLPALLLALAAGVPAASAQTVILRNAPPGSTAELTWNNGAPLSARTDNFGDASFTVPAHGEASAQVHVDVCGNSVRVVMVAFGQPATAPDVGCTRKDHWGVYVMHPTTTFVVDMNGADSNVYVSQGPPPREWVLRGDELRRGRIPWTSPRKGLALSAGAGVGRLPEEESHSCGNVSQCEQTSFSGAITLGAEYWITPHIAAFASYIKPTDVVIEGSDSNFRFNSRLQTRIAAFGGKGGFLAGPARIYAVAGVNHHEATSTTNETVDDITVTVDNVTQTIKGGTHASGQKSDGWNWLFGGGVEAWMSKWIAIYGEYNRAKLKGTPQDATEGGIDQQLTTITGGIRIRLGR